jgi:putative spermidine/putrescine transport system permease protein
LTSISVAQSGQLDARRAALGPAHLLWAPAAISFLLLALPQVAFIWTSFHEDIGLGAVSDFTTLANYRAIVVDPFYLLVCFRTFGLAMAAALITLFFALPTAYALARMNRRLAALILGLILTTSLITDVIKVMGLTFILSPSGLLNNVLSSTGLIRSPLVLLNNSIGVLVGLVQYTLPVVTLFLFGVAQTIPPELEEAAESLGARRIVLFSRIIIPIVWEAIVGSGLIAFNMAAGAFTSAILLGGGKVITLPVLIQQKIIQSTEYGMGAALATALLFVGFVINIVAGIMFLRGRGRRISRSVLST